MGIVETRNAIRGRDETAKRFALGTWLDAMDAAISYAQVLDKLDVHKSISNRLLEPFAHMTTIVTATEYGNFFHLRAHKDAQPEFQELAFLMLDLYRTNTPTLLESGSWHLPFVRPEEYQACVDLRMISTARCARISYALFKETTFAQDIELHDRLAASGHWSPFEHVATPIDDLLSPVFFPSNFEGWKQYRGIFPLQNVSVVDLDAIAARRNAQ